jgi:hypothetical protein
MKKSIILTVAVVTSFAVLAQTKAGKIDNTKHPALYVCPVQSPVIINELGKCPFCGMDLNLSPKEQMKAQESKGQACPLYAGITSDRTGKKLNVSPKEEMKMRVVGISSPRRPEESALVAKY